MEGMELDMFVNRYKDQRVLVTGHTGFKGSWLCEWLLKLGAEVHGLALSPRPHETLFGQLNLANRITADHRIDVRNLKEVSACIRDTKPRFLFHLAAQPLVRLSFDEPVSTLETNVMGTANILEALRLSGEPCNAVVVTTDKCYENREWVHAYREEDQMGGHDPYSASKACAEIVTNAFRSSYFHSDDDVKIATGRAGNVIGGGDWAKDRIVPDIFRALRQDTPVCVRNRHATRPWQHVLEPLSGYLWLAALLHLESVKRPELAAAFNFGPALDSNRTVLEVVEEILKIVPGKWNDVSDPNAVHEAGRLNLAVDKAWHLLHWKPTWEFQTAIRKTADWYTQEGNDADVQQLTASQIDDYCTAASHNSVAWAQNTAAQEVAKRS